ncbi:Alpha/Beta hydrolase protein [Lasiosphaeria hispida]|uniref:Alpha/Beta hydrolase protein n=1 Tax=Lasiosphaeria hispida TaxID=260671 RepID=A0AAJ0H895_9PEZI|nr:Alpha/Beta hydrolase protein [Lasiosphaeria hispida]
MAGYCKDCFTGTVQSDVVLSGIEQDIHGLPTYVTGPEAGTKPRGTIVVLPDAFGWTLPNTRSLADAYARRVQATVYLPDFMNGHALPEWTIQGMEYTPPATDFFVLRAIKRAWAILQVIPALLLFIYTCRMSVGTPRIRAFLGAVRVAEPGTKVGVAGFCWGGYHAVVLTHDIPQNKTAVDGKGEGYPLVDCAFSAHPGLVKVPKDVQGVVQPLSMANGDDDEYMGREKMKLLKQVLEGKNEEQAAEVHEVVVYPGAKHGFANRADWHDPLHKEYRDKSQDQAVRWFRKHFEAGSDD